MMLEVHHTNSTYIKIQEKPMHPHLMNDTIWPVATVACFIDEEPLFLERTDIDAAHGRWETDLLMVKSQEFDDNMGSL